MSARALVTAACAALTLLGMAAPAAGAPGSSVTFGVEAAGGRGDQRTTLNYSLSPGSSAADRIAVVNYSNQPLDLQVYGADATLDSQGGFAVQPASARPALVGSWIRVSGAASKIVRVPAEGVAANGGTAPGRVELPVTLQVPAMASGGSHAGAIVVSLGSTAVSSAQSMGFEQRVALRVYVSVTGTRTSVSTHALAAHRRNDPVANRPWLLPTVLSAIGILLVLVVMFFRRPRHVGGNPHVSSSHLALASNGRRRSSGAAGRHRNGA